jgi:HPt (histidine-containing phosphotransfer) domain-containing protein
MTPMSGRFGGDPSRDSLQPRVIMLDKDVEQLVTRFLTRKMADLTRLREALEMGDFDSIRRLGHDLKGAGEGFGFPELSILGAKFELAAPARDTAQIAACIASMERYLTRLQVRYA